MNILSTLLLAAIGGGIICAIIQLFIDFTALTPARILVGLVISGVILYAVGAYDYLFSLLGEGIALPLLGFGATIARGIKDAITNEGIIGILTGGLSAAAAGISFALFLGFLYSLISKSRAKRISK